MFGYKNKANDYFIMRNSKIDLPRFLVLSFWFFRLRSFFCLIFFWNLVSKFFFRQNKLSFYDNVLRKIKIVTKTFFIFRRWFLFSNTTLVFTTNRACNSWFCGCRFKGILKWFGVWWWCSLVFHISEQLLLSVLM